MQPARHRREGRAAPGYAPFFTTALFFADLHLVVLTAGQRWADADLGRVPGGSDTRAGSVDFGMSQRHEA
jgi:hypothetical protein